MKFKNLVVLVTCLLCFKALAQTPSFKLSVPFKLDKKYGLMDPEKYTPVKTLISDNNGFRSIILAVRTKTGDSENKVEYFDTYQPFFNDVTSHSKGFSPGNYHAQRLMHKEYALINVTPSNANLIELEIPKKIGNHYFHATNIIDFNQQLYVLGNYIQANQTGRQLVGDSAEVVLLPIDIDSYELHVDKIKSLAKFKFDLAQGKGFHYYAFRKSSNGSKLGLIVYGPVLKNEKNQTEYVVYNKDFKRVLRKVVPSMDCEENECTAYRMEEFIVTNDGDILEFGNYYPDANQSHKFYQSDVYNAKKGKKRIQGICRRISNKDIIEHKLTKLVDNVQYILERMDKSIVAILSKDKYLSRNELSTPSFNLIHVGVDHSAVTEQNIKLPKKLYSSQSGKKEILDDPFSLTCAYADDTPDGSLFVIFNQYRNMMFEKVVEDKSMLVYVKNNSVVKSESFLRNVSTKSTTSTNNKTAVFKTDNGYICFYNGADENDKTLANIRNSVCHVRIINNIGDEISDVNTINEIKGFSSLCYRASSDVRSGKSILISTKDGYRCVWINN